MARIEQRSTRLNEIFNIESTTFVLVPEVNAHELQRFREAADEESRYDAFGAVFASIFTSLLDFLSQFDGRDWIQVSFRSDALEADIRSAVMLVNNFDANNFFQQIQAVLQSNQQFDFDDGLRLIVERI